ncbi:MAG TPA: rhodanese-like domain-containing protein [Rhodanobacteraceae bacterium]|nr:rhodanese-like domain-containing protein [Rhodanobacteraceae bacterium]
MNDFLTRLPEFIGNHLVLSAAFLALLTAVIITELMHLLRGDKLLTPAALTQLINRDNALVIDLSPQADFEKGHIPGAKHVAWSAFDPENKDLAKVKEHPIAVCCRSGVTASKASQRLLKAGFTRVYTLAGGIDAWRRADLPLAKGKA